MFKKLFLLIALLGTTAFIVLFGEGFDFWNVGAATETAVVSTPTQTAVLILTPEATATNVPTSTSEITATIESTVPSATATVEFTATATKTATATNTATAVPTATDNHADDLFAVQTGSPVFLTNFAHPSEACAWDGVAGQIFSSAGLPLTDYIVKLEGTYNGAAIDMVSVTGIIANNPYGPGSFEFVLGNVALDTQNLLTIQLFDPNGVEVTSPLSLVTSSSCSQNLQIINFKQK